jgi:putative ABC transport system ATP-binding protein
LNARKRRITFPAPNAVFHATGLCKTYLMGEAEVDAIRDIDVGMFEREFAALLGLSGSAKSILLNILGGLETPTSGRTWWLDHNIVGADDAELTRYRREHVGFVFQFFNNHGLRAQTSALRPTG